MRSLQETRKRWNTIFDSYQSTSSLTAETITLKNGNKRPCDIGIRSICWKLFLLFPKFNPETWPQILRSERSAFSELRNRYLAPFEADAVFEGPNADPLAEDESNPWKQFRKDEELRREILQDVERCMPDNTYFRDSAIQNSLLNLLFIYCKLNQDVSYRQGMHEIVAVILWVVSCDAISPDPLPSDFTLVDTTGKPSKGSFLEESLPGQNDFIMREALDPRYIEHDTFSLFQIVMRSAKAWYELGDDADGKNRRGEPNHSPIVEKSKHIHETLLMAVDPELADHLKTLDVLPQVFLIRWIRLLFGREFPFEELLQVWDALFAEDPNLQLVDLVCVAMLLRVRWPLMEADYSTALSIVLRYPSPGAPNLPATLVADAVYLRDHLSYAGGKHIITKYSHKAPAIPALRPNTPGIARGKSPLGSPTRFIQTAQLESIVQDVARNVLDRGEKWGVNRAVREAVGDIKKNVQGFQQQSNDSSREAELLKKSRELSKRLKAEEEGRKTLEKMMGLSIETLEQENVSEEERGKALERLKHVRDCLGDSSRKPDESFLRSPPPSTVATPTTPSVPSPFVSRRSSSATVPKPLSSTLLSGTPLSGTPLSSPPVMGTPRPPVSPPGTFVKTSFKNNSDPDFLVHRPRASLAQSSFAWMLGDDPAIKNKTGFVSSSLKGSGNMAGGDSDNVKMEEGHARGAKSPWGPADDEGFDLGSLRRK
ncbi:hypothetical protein RUND412_007539 [Rhizina undulata]